MDDDSLTPMIRVGSQDFFIFEPALVEGSKAVIPHRFFLRDGKMQMLAWPLEEDKEGKGWVVRKDKDMEMPCSQLMVSWLDFVASYQNRGLTDPRIILGVRTSGLPSLLHWKETTPAEGNRWRKKANGCQVLTFPMWLYCDDTSGNSSKKWNKHNSFLFTAAGLPRKHVQREFNVHFLSTSNIAPPLEMLDGIVDQLEEAQDKGVWAWDCENKSLVLLVPCVFALLSDNPMQSEMACQCGLMAKFFCRICIVKSHDNADKEKEVSPLHPGPIDTSASSAGSDGGSGAGSDVESDASVGGTPGKGRKKKVETKEEMIERVTRFMQKATPHKPCNTQEQLNSMLKEATEVGGKTRSAAIGTKHGVKDTYLGYFIDRIYSSYENLKGTVRKAKAIEAMMKTFPKCIYSPVWCIKDLDPHADTPVEILHVILLGFVKYFWCDAVSRCKDKDKAVLMARLASASVEGLGIPPLAGKTLVTYAGSLTGRDFRALAQIAPFCLHDLVPEACVETWLALSRLVPLVWQPEIEDIDAHIKHLEVAIDHFLNCAVNWTPRWFNKPKFLLLHLPNHIHRFGPASLFATEGFESFNAVIRGFSIHSNRQAPSRDIGRGFAHGNHLRHMLSGGFFLPNFGETIPTVNKVQPSTEGWRSIAPRPEILMRLRNFALEMFGMPIDDAQNQVGRCEGLSPEREWQGLQANKANMNWMPPQATGTRYRAAKKFILKNRDACKNGSWIIYEFKDQIDGTTNYHLGQVREIVNIVKPGINDINNTADYVLLQTAGCDQYHPKYKMPRITLQPTLLFIPFEFAKCTVNVQHNCLDNNCTIDYIHTVMQEREQSEEREMRLQHVKPRDLILNTGQMRDSQFVQFFQTPPILLNRSEAILHGVVLEIQVAKTRQAQDAGFSSTVGKSKGKGKVVEPQPIPQSNLRQFVFMNNLSN
ncbi:hypothetical protein M422DRAFT_256592 [Sphaerobolus stellatus SS14]|uniref:Uncharacterized protein n=1 Tax=Sphaerobolus stellatus (strain SS14) TaxID=990650 RepID=A0A0C9VQS1_SPHS4|nr:hypothetical protein M422DRAFT_256592 [Sphaerobolus stellatus SS14]